MALGNAKLFVTHAPSCSPLHASACNTALCQIRRSCSGACSNSDICCLSWSKAALRCSAKSRSLSQNRWLDQRERCAPTIFPIPCRLHLPMLLCEVCGLAQVVEMNSIEERLSPARDRSPDHGVPGPPTALVLDHQHLAQPRRCRRWAECVSKLQRPRSRKSHWQGPLRSAPAWAEPWGEQTRRAGHDRAQRCEECEEQHQSAPAIVLEPRMTNVVARRCPTCTEQQRRPNPQQDSPPCSEGAQSEEAARAGGCPTTIKRLLASAVAYFRRNT